jgi:NADPH-dependent glutamate synthase beta subunit-like oxidoreductase
MKKLGVEIKYRTEPTAKDLKNFDVVLCACGGKVAKPAIPGIDLSSVITFEDVLRCKTTKCEYYPEDKADPVECGENVLIWGDHFGAADAAEKLGTAGKKVTIVTENGDFAEWMEPCHRDVMMKRFACDNGEGLKSKTYTHPVAIIGSSSVLEIKKDGTVVIVDSTFKCSTVKADTVVLAKVEPNDSMYEGLLEAGLNVVKIGDAKSVRNVRSAVADGANVAFVVDKSAILNANNELISDLPTGIELS